MADLGRTALRTALSLAFLYFGLEKLLGLPAAVALYDALGFGQWPRYVTGSVETAGALLLWTRAAPLAALALIATMIVGATAKGLLVGPPIAHIVTLGIGTAILLALDIRSRRLPRY